MKLHDMMDSSSAHTLLPIMMLMMRLMMGWLIK